MTQPLSGSATDMICCCGSCRKGYFAALLNGVRWQHMYSVGYSSVRLQQVYIAHAYSLQSVTVKCVKHAAFYMVTITYS